MKINIYINRISSDLHITRALLCMHKNPESTCSIGEVCKSTIMFDNDEEGRSITAIRQTVSDNCYTASQQIQQLQLV